MDDCVSMGSSDVSKFSTESCTGNRKKKVLILTKERKRREQACPVCSGEALVQVCSSFILMGTVWGPPCQDPQGPPLLALDVVRENAALPFRLDPVPERAHVRLLFIDRHHVHVAPTLIPDDSCVHSSLTDARRLKMQEEY